MEKSFKKSIIAAALVCVAGSAQAEQAPRWDFISASYISIDMEDLEPTGLGVSGSKLLSEDLFAVASYSMASDDYAGVDIDVDTFSLGLGLRHGLSATTDLYGVLSYEKWDVDASAGGFSQSASDDAIGLEGGLRSMVAENLELSGFVGAIANSDDSEAVFGVGARYFFNHNLAAGLGYETSDDVDTTSLSLSYFF